MSPNDRETLLAHAYAIENEAAERYQDLADQMYGCSNDEVGDLFARLAEIEGKHAEELRTEHGAAVIPIAGADYAWGTLESPEAIPFGEMHYLIQPHQALTLALAAEQRALDFYKGVAAQAPTSELRAMAEEYAEEEAGHVKLVQEWLERYPEPEEGWDEDMDAPESL